MQTIVIDYTPVKLNGELRVEITARDTDGEPLHTDTINLASAHSRKRFVTAVGQRSEELDAADLDRKLVGLAGDLRREADDARKKREQKRPTNPQRVDALAESFLRSLNPVWHRKRRTVYLDAVPAEVLVTQLWTLASNTQFDAVEFTKEGLESKQSSGDPPNYRTRLGIFKEAMQVATARVLRSLPEVEDVAEDRTATRDELLGRLAAWLVAARTFRSDIGTAVSLNYFQWASGLAVGEGWRQCFTAPVFGRHHDEVGIQIAVHGDHLTAELRYSTNRKLAADLRTHKLAVPDHQVRVPGRKWRTWLVVPAVLDRLATNVPAGSGTE